MRPAICESALAEANARDCATITNSIYIFDSDCVSGADANAAFSFVGRQRSENLHYFASQFDRNQSVAVRIKSRHGARLRHDGGFERLRRLRLEAEQGIEDGAHNQRLEGHPANYGDWQREHGADEFFGYETGRTKSDEEVEQHARREP